MLRWTRSQKRLAADKLSDLANLAAAGLVFGQVVTGVRPSRLALVIATIGFVLWGAIFALALVIGRETSR